MSAADSLDAVLCQGCGCVLPETRRGTYSFYACPECLTSRVDAPTIRDVLRGGHGQPYTREVVRRVLLSLGMEPGEAFDRLRGAP